VTTSGFDHEAQTVDALEARLAQELTLVEDRAIVVVVVAVAESRLTKSIEDARARVLDLQEISDERVVRFETRRDEAGRQRLADLNRARDVLLRDARLVWLRAYSPADVRFLRATAPDLLSAPDLFVEIHAPVCGSWADARERIRARMIERHATLDFTGLLPAEVQRRELPLEALYQPLVDIDEPAPEFPALASSCLGLLVLGHPGTGKTTFARHLAWSYAKGARDPLEIGDALPLLVSLSDYAFAREHDRVTSLVDFLPSWLEERGITGGERISEHLPEILLLLDGLDEVRSVEVRRSILGEASRLVKDAQVGGLVMTGRSFLADELRTQDHPLRVVFTRAVEPAQREAFLSAFVRLRRGDEADPRSLIERIEHDDDLRALASTPLMLAFMAILDELEGRLPDRRIEIYYRLGEMLVDRWTRVRSLGTSTDRRARPTRADALRVLGPLAWWTIERGGGAIPETALRRELERIEGKRNTPEEAKRRAGALLDLLRADTALLVPRPGGRWSFVHGSLGEYFAGVHVERDRLRWQALLDDPFHAEWREIVLFCAGQLGTIDGRIESLDLLVESIIRRSSRQGRYDAKYPSLLMGMLLESPGLSRAQTSELMRRLLTLVFTAYFSTTAARQVHREFLRFMLSARDGVADALREGLTEWLSKNPGRARWDRIFPRVELSPPLQQRLSSMSGMEAGFTLLGVSVWGLLMFCPHRFGIDITPTLAQLRMRDDWRYRLAIWLATASQAERDRPFPQISAELGLTLRGR